MPYREKFFEKAFRASLSQNRIGEGAGLDKVDASEQRGFRDEVDLHLGAIKAD